jgi:hypothetical protein
MKHLLVVPVWRDRYCHQTFSGRRALGSRLVDGTYAPTGDRHNDINIYSLPPKVEALVEGATGDVTKAVTPHDVNIIELVDRQVGWEGWNRF